MRKRQPAFLTSVPPGRFFRFWKPDAAGPRNFRSGQGPSGLHGHTGNPISQLSVLDSRRGRLVRGLPEVGGGGGRVMAMVLTGTTTWKPVSRLAAAGIRCNRSPPPLTRPQARLEARHPRILIGEFGYDRLIADIFQLIQTVDQGPGAGEDNVGVYRPSID